MGSALKIFSQRAGHYLGTSDSLEIITTGLVDVQDMDLLVFEIKNIYKESIPLIRGTTIHKHIIPANILSGLGVGDYEISVTLNVEQGQQANIVLYKVVPLPVTTFTSLTPDTLKIPLREPVSVTGKWNVEGEEMNSINGTTTLFDATSKINQLN